MENRVKINFHMGLRKEWLLKMGLLDKLLKKQDDKTVYAPMNGTYIPLKEIPDEVFSSGVLGQGCGIEPEEGQVVAPVEGKVGVIADTKHSIAIIAKDGREFLIHVGMDTVDMKGDGFDVLVNENDNIKVGDVLLKFDPEKIKKAGHPVTTAFVVVNSDSYSHIAFETGVSRKACEIIGTVE